MHPDALSRNIAEIQRLLSERLRIRGRTLDRQIARAGRLLPRRVRSEARFLLQAQGLMRNPKLARMIDANRADRAHGVIVDYLKGIDPEQRKRDRLVGLAALWAFIALVTIGLAIAVAHWRGLI